MIDTNMLWQTAQEQWPQVDRDKTYLMFVKVLQVEALVPKTVQPDERTSFAGAILSVAQLTGEDTGLSLDEQLELMRQSSGFEMERIALEPVGDFVMGYGPRADLLAVKGYNGRQSNL